MNSFAVIGGDKRMEAVVRHFSEAGKRVSSFGLSKDIENEVTNPETLSDIIHKSECIVLPLPFSSDGETVNMPLSENTLTLSTLLELITPDQLLFGGKINDAFASQLKDKKINYYDYSQREEFSVLNAAPTAEGAVEIVLNRLPITLGESKCLVIGFGRIGKALSHILHGFHADVTVSARRYSDLAWIGVYGCKPILTAEIKESIHQYDVIFNTVPLRLLDKNILKAVKPDCLIVDLASKPGGVDFKFAEESGITAIHALSLPGKSAPKTAGTIIGNTILNIIKEREVSL